MGVNPYMVEYLFDMESHELEELGLLHKVLFESSPELYSKLRGEIMEMISDTIKHFEMLYRLIDELRLEGAFQDV